MAHPLIDLTEQEIFDKAYLGLASQGFERSIAFLSEDGIDGCAYSADGKHCAIGWVCAEVGIYPKEQSNPLGDTFWESINENKPSGNRMRFLRELQAEGHDSCLTPEGMKTGLEAFALEHSLTVPAIPFINVYPDLPNPSFLGR